MFVRLYTGEDGQAHFEELDPQIGTMQTVTGITYRSHEPGDFEDWHTAPRRQYIITLSGYGEIGIGDGTVRRFGPGDVMLADDLTGQGHTTRAVGDSPRISAAIPVD